MIGLVYKLTSEKGGLVYIGSTVQTLNSRLNVHKQDMKRWLDGEIGKWASFQVLEFDDAKMELIEELEVANLDELHKREGHYQRTMECVNKKIAGRTQQEYREEHKEQINACKKKYREEHKEEINALKKIKHICECGGKYTKTHKAYHMKTKKHQDWLNQTETQRVP